MARHLEGVPAGAIVVALVQGRGHRGISRRTRCGRSGRSGRATDLGGRFRAAHAVIGVEGRRAGRRRRARGIRAGLGSPWAARGRSALVLEAFELR